MQRCLDFGSGSGELVQFLLEARLQVAAYEPNTSRHRQSIGV